MVHHEPMSELTTIPAPDGVAAAQYSHVVLGTGRFVAIEVEAFAVVAP
ncbi:hypothetical protein SAMN06272771_6516 [Streptomyces sp. Ag82_O1-12]|nr:hypothetical protein SAMN06272771_6516 [Streptomyces sp. Ag82_O1-12]SOD49054.1 hypothetical protein SAMN06272727_6521 [Streptomyces sp. Ag82_G6-1]